jgi:hypothetical protein
LVIEKVSATLRPRRDDAPLWYPNLETPQEQAYNSPADVIYYGGAAGGGKTDLGLGLPFTRHQVSVFFRRKYTDLKDAIRRSRKIVGIHGRYNGNDHAWTLSDHRVLEFGAMQHEDDKESWQGRPHDLYVFDEVTQFTRTQVQYVIAWNRSTDPRQRCRVLLLGNPPTTPEGEWVLEWFAPWLDERHPNPAVPGELRWFVYIPDDDVYIEVPDSSAYYHKSASGEVEELTPRSRTFIPARLEHNPYLRNTNYKSVLQSLPEPLRSALLKGDFNILRTDDPWQVMPTDWVKAAQARWRLRKPQVRLTALGVDPSRGGKCKFCLCPRYGNYFGRVEKHAGRLVKDGPKGAALIYKALDRDNFASCDVNLDLIGIGTAVYDAACVLQTTEWEQHKDFQEFIALGIIKQLPRKVTINGINVSVPSRSKDKSKKFKFRNLRSEMTWRLREMLDPDHGEDIALPDDPELLADLTAYHWSLSVSGITVETKDDTALRIGRSPDVGDAVILASYQPRNKGGFDSW